MVKDNDILQAVRDRDVDNLNKLLQRSKNGKSKEDQPTLYTSPICVVDGLDW